MVLVTDVDDNDVSDWGSFEGDGEGMADGQGKGRNPQRLYAVPPLPPRLDGAKSKFEPRGLEARSPKSAKTAGLSDA